MNSFFLLYLYRKIGDIMNNGICPMCSAPLPEGVQVCPRCGFQVQQQPTKYQLGVQPQNGQPPITPKQNGQVVQQPVQQAQQIPQQQVQQVPPQYQQPVTGKVMRDEENPAFLVAALVMIILARFFAGLICSGIAIALCLSYKGKSPFKGILLVVAGIEFVLTVIGLVSLL